MVKPIPLFAFVFAANAATRIDSTPIPALKRRKIGLADERSAQLSPPQTSVVPIWRSLLERRAEVCVKVGIVGGGRGKHLNLAIANQTPCGSVEEIWLCEISETSRGLSGLVRVTGDTQIKPGRIVRFGCDNVLDWTLGLIAQTETAELEKTSPPALRESVPT